MTAFYNEIDPVAAQWLRNLIAAGHIAPGVVDERSIEDVRPDELAGYVQCHFFAGIGIWSYALRQAGWPDDRPVWTGSCPCQPFSAAGEGKGFADERHLWPAWFHLIEQCRPATLLGEQVASSDADPWIDLVCADLERLGYAFGATPFPAAGVGCPGIRDRAYWVAHADGRHAGAEGLQRSGQHGQQPQDGGVVRLADATRGGLGIVGSAMGARDIRHADCGGAEPGRLGNAASTGLEGSGGPDVPGTRRGSEGGSIAGPGAAPCGMGDAERIGPQGSGDAGSGEGVGLARPQPARAGANYRPGPVNGFWRDADWLLCTDGRWRPVEPSTFPLAARSAGDVGQLRAYGNGLNAAAAEVFIRCVTEPA